MIKKVINRTAKEYKHVEAIMVGEISQRLYDFTYIGNLKNKTKPKDTENRLVVIRGEGGWRMGKTGEGGQLYDN